MKQTINEKFLRGLLGLQVSKVNANIFQDENGRTYEFHGEYLITSADNRAVTIHNFTLTDIVYSGMVAALEDIYGFPFNVSDEVKLMLKAAASMFYARCAFEIYTTIFICKDHPISQVGYDLIFTWLTAHSGFRSVTCWGQFSEKLTEEAEKLNSMIEFSSLSYLKLNNKAD